MKKRDAVLAEESGASYCKCTLACDEVWVPMISGRGLGITGGTVDKLDSIPGFNVNLDERRTLKQLQRIGVFTIGQTADICPADKKLYALREEAGGKSRLVGFRCEVR